MIEQFNSSFIPRIAVTCEQVRLIMKMWAFLRENVYKAVQNHNENLKSKKNFDNNFSCPSFSQFLYFLFAPTLVYRDNYPRRHDINWNFVLRNFLGSILCVACQAFLMVHYFKPTFQNFGLFKLTIGKFLGILLEGVLPSTLFMTCLFFGFLHCWLNAWAEMLRFGDRMFYQDWWNSNSYADYYKKWNIIVHDWLRSYIFNDIKRSFNSKYSGIIGSFLVINISAFVHEYIVIMAFRSFCPGFIVQFGVIGLIVKFVVPKNTNGKTITPWNICLWTSLMFGNSLLLSIYVAEWYAVRNCPLSFNSSKYKQFIPRFISGDCY